MRPNRPSYLCIVVIAALHATLVAPAARAEAPSPYATRAVYIHIDSPEPVDLQGETGDRHVPFETVCTSPCDTLVPADGKYRIASNSVRPSRPFTLASGAQREDMVVKPSSSTGFASGIGLMAGGGACIGVGFLLLVAGAFSDGPSQGDNGRSVALGLVIGGLVAIPVGLVLTVVNARTKVSSTVTSAPPDVTPNDPEPNPERIILLPTRSSIAMEKALPAPTSVPVLSLHF